MARAASPDFPDWLGHVRGASKCTRPVRLRGQMLTVEAGTSRLLTSLDTANLPPIWSSLRRDSDASISRSTTTWPGFALPNYSLVFISATRKRAALLCGHVTRSRAWR